VADIGSGILTELLLKYGNTVFGIEPNEEMRRVAKTNLCHYPGFRSIQGTAESTTLPTRSVDFITAAQSFHWFQPLEAKAEFLRILKVNGWVVLIWNNRKADSPFLQEYEGLVAWMASQQKNRVKHEDISESTLAEFLGDYRTTRLENFQWLDLKGLVGRLLSASYSPLPGDPSHSEFVRKATDLFNRYEQGGVVTLEYWTEVYAGQPS
jgi:SAM-dependent methyltransferase